MTKVMRKEARHTQRRDRASGVPLEILVQNNTLLETINSVQDESLQPTLKSKIFYI